MKNPLQKNIVLISFIQRTWPLIIVMLLSNYAIMSQHKFACFGVWEVDEMKGGVLHPKTILEHFGGIAQLLPFGTAVILAALASIHLIFRKTIDADAHSKRTKEDWDSCSPYQRVQQSNFVKVGFAIAFSLLAASICRGAPPQVDEAARWNSAEVNPRFSIPIAAALRIYEKNKWRYEKIQAMRPNGVPAPILFCLHMRESDANFTRHAHEGSSLQHRTRDEPKGRLPDKEPPYTFEQSAYDAYYVCERPPLDQINWRDKQAALDKMESFNGFGYRWKGIAAPYLWSGTSLYSRGKYVRDGYFDRTAIDQQLGCAAILLTMQKQGIKLTF